MTKFTTILPEKEQYYQIYRNWHKTTKENIISYGREIDNSTTEENTFRDEGEIDKNTNRENTITDVKLREYSQRCWNW